LNPRKPDLQRWRETFAEKLRDLGVEAEATRRFVRGQPRRHEDLWRKKARDGGRLRIDSARAQPGMDVKSADSRTLEAWVRLGQALSASDTPGDRELARAISGFVPGMSSRGAREETIGRRLSPSNLSVRR
jgi:hypothetical protein